MSQNLTDQSLYQLPERACGLAVFRAPRELGPALVSEYEAERLQIPVGVPIHLMRSVVFLERREQ
jgi:DNA-binding GntR family transcriptional regulator